MNEQTAIALNVQSPNISSVVYAVQNDRLSRHISAQLLDGASEWAPPAGALAAIRYLKPDGTAGFYDTDENGDPAIVINGSIATLTLVEQALTFPGDVYMQLNFYTESQEKLTTFSWLLRVQKSVLTDATIISSDYFNTLTKTIAEGIEVAQQLTFPVPVSNGGTGADNPSEARSNLGLGNLAIENSPLPLNKGGTGATTEAGARSKLGLGNVANERQYSESNPPPYPVISVNGETGAVTIPTNESGSSYCKMPDGTLIQWGTSQITSGSTTVYESPINLASVTIQFPISFASTNYKVFGSGKYSTGASIAIAQTGETRTSCSVHWWDVAARTFSTSVPLVIKWCAIGRWN